MDTSTNIPELLIRGLSTWICRLKPRAILEHVRVKGLSEIIRPASDPEIKLFGTQTLEPSQADQ